MWHSSKVTYVEALKEIRFNNKNGPKEEDLVNNINLEDGFMISARVCKKCGKQWKYITAINLPIEKDHVVQANNRKGKTVDRQTTVFIPKQSGDYIIKMAYGHGTYQEIINSGEEMREIQVIVQ